MRATTAGLIELGTQRPGSRLSSGLDILGIGGDLFSQFALNDAHTVFDATKVDDERWLDLTGTSGDYASAPDTNLLDADTAHLHQSVGDWQAASGASSVALNSSSVFGDNCARATANGTNVAMFGTPAGTNGFPVSGSTEYSVGAFVRSSTTDRIRLQAVNYDGAGSFLGTDNQPYLDVTAGEWVYLDLTQAGYTTRASAAFLRFVIEFENVPSNGDTLDLDTVVLRTGSDATFVPSIHIVRNIDLRCAVALDDWTPAAASMLVSKYLSTTNRSWYLGVLTSGVVRLLWTVDGNSVITKDSTVAPTVSDGELLLVRATLDVDNGASGNDVKFYTKSSTPSSAAADLRSDTGWTQLGSTVTTAGTTSIFSGTAEVGIGDREDVDAPAAGRMFAAVVKDGIDGTTVLDVDFTSQTAGATSFTDDTGNHTVTVNGSAKVAPLTASYLYLTGNAGDYASVPDHASLDITGDIDVRAAVALDDWTPGLSDAMVGKADGTTNRSFWFDVKTSTGELRLIWSPDGTSGNQIVAESTVTPTVTNGHLLLVRATLDVDNGASGHDVKFYTKSSTPTAAAADLRADTGWTQLGSTVTGGATTSIFAGTAKATCGAIYDDGSVEPMAGRMFAAVIKDGIDGTTVLDVDFTDKADGTTSFTDDTGNHTVTVNGSAEVRAGRDALRGWDSVAATYRAAVQATSAKRPTFVASAVNGQPAVRFDGTDDMLQIGSYSALSGANPKTVIAVAMSEAQAQPYHHVVHFGAPSNNQAYGAAWHNGPSGWTNHLWGNDTASGQGTLGQFAVVVLRYDGTDDYIYVNGGAAAGTQTVALNTGTGVLRLGSRISTEFEHLDGDIHYVALYDGDLYTDNLTRLNQICQALANRVGTTWTDIWEIIDGGSPASTGPDIIDGGTPASIGHDTIDGGSPTSF